MASSMAFFWAEEPSAFRVPSAHSALAPDPVPVEPEPAVLLSEPQAESARAPTTATLARRPKR